MLGLFLSDVAHRFGEILERTSPRRLCSRVIEVQVVRNYANQYGQSSDTSELSGKSFFRNISVAALFVDSIPSLGLFIFIDNDNAGQL